MFLGLALWIASAIVRVESPDASAFAARRWDGAALRLSQHV